MTIEELHEKLTARYYHTLDCVSDEPLMALLEIRANAAHLAVDFGCTEQDIVDWAQQRIDNRK